ncbi:anti-phage dCTP deaminase [Alcaligenes phenolicus]|uniref:anti-phage dCTP deaminase n=1 Tax=Alcaligenes phenolicus TaxID=232846 RepID=UPI002AA80B4B|nr:anti-phage dCTP deaminase [Alcaligenes phenolicus]
MESAIKSIVPINESKKKDNSRAVIDELSVNELVFAVVGPAGSGTSWVANALCEQAKKIRNKVEVKVIKGSSVIKDWAEKKDKQLLVTGNSLDRARNLQDLGDEIRKDDVAGVAVQLISEIRKSRQLYDGENSFNKDVFRVYVLDSLKHPAEVELLRRVYREAFCLVGVVCETEQRLRRLKDSKCEDSGQTEIKKFIARDEDSGTKYGQKVAETFHLADFFVDNTPARFLDSEKKNENPLWDVNDQLGRLFDILTHAKLVRPKPNEIGMFHAYGAQLRSACLSRQVGAALTDSFGNLLSTGTNEVPRAGGGVYGSVLTNFDDEDDRDHRCAYSGGYCRNTKTGIEIIEELVDAIPELKTVDRDALQKKLKNTSLGRLLEFSRAVHAEMDAILSATRQGASPVGGRLFVTTFPCHYCARHIVSAGIDEVQYIEPYPKSRALALHGDAIVQSPDGWLAPSSSSKSDDKKRSVLFRPFTGVAPRMYRTAFLKDRKLKNEEGTMKIGKPEWASGLLRKSYKDVEAALLGEQGNGQ